MSAITQAIRERVSTRDVLESYGYEVNRQGFCRCPLHQERTPSLKVYQNGKGWYCFGCHKGGDVIALVMQLERLPFPAAVQEMNSRFALGLLDDERPKRDSEAERRARERKLHKLEYENKLKEFSSCVGRPERRDRMEFLDYWLGEHSDWR